MAVFHGLTQIRGYAVDGCASTLAASLLYRREISCCECCFVCRCHTVGVQHKDVLLEPVLQGLGVFPGREKCGHWTHKSSLLRFAAVDVHEAGHLTGPVLAGCLRWL